MITNQHRPSLNELASGERYDRVPQELRRKDISPKGHKGICVGRGELLQGLSDYFAQQWRDSAVGTLRDDDCVAAVLTNAPGAGKTTVRQEFAYRQAHQGIAHIEVPVGELASASKLIHTLRRYAEQGDISRPIQPGERASMMRKAWHYGKKLIGESDGLPITAGTDATARKDGDTVKAIAATGTIKMVQEGIERLREALRKNEPTSTAEALRAVNETHNGRFIISVDECHRLSNPVLQTEGLRRNIDCLAKPTGRSELQIQGGGMVLAGLASFPDDLGRLGLTRAKVEWLDELDSASAEAIVRHYLERTEMPKARRDAITERWVPGLARAFRHWPQHSAAAGAFAQELLIATSKKWKYNPADPDEGELLQHTITLAARDIKGLYQQRVRSAKSAQPAIRAEDIVALANITHDEIPQAALTELLASSMEELRIEVTAETLRLCLRDLKLAGLCRDRTVQRDGRDELYYSFAMPGLRPHITENAPPKRMRQCTERAQRILRDTGG